MIEIADRIKTVEEYYFSKKLQEVKSIDSLDFPVINLGIGSPDLPPDPSVIQALNNSSVRSDAHAYQSYRGIPELRTAIAAYYEQYFKVMLDPEVEILPLVGSKEGIMHITQAFVNPGDRVLIPNPAYPTYAAVSNLAQAKIEFYDLTEENAWQIDFDALEKMGLDKVKLFWLNSPHMPTGVQYSKQTLEKLVYLANKHNFLIVNDNPYSMILNNDYQSILSIEGARDVALELNSLSKSHNMAGWRIGWCAGHSELIQAILKVKSNMDSGMFKPLQIAASKALNLGQDWFESLNQVYLKRRKFAELVLQKLNCTFDPNQQGLFLWAKLPKGMGGSAEFVDHILYKHKVFLSPGLIFGTKGEGYIRISLCADENQLTAALERLKNFKYEN